MDLKTEVSEAIAKSLRKGKEEILALIETPPSPELGDYAFPCFTLAKELRKSPQVIAAELSAKIKSRLFSKVEAKGPYLNIFIDRPSYAKSVLKSKTKFPKTKKKVMVEFSQPNTHKEFHVGHLRNASLGASLVEILKFTGNEVISANYIGDIGTHVAKAIWCLSKFHPKDKIPKNKGKYLGQIYVEASAKTEENKDYEKEVSDILQRLEAREPRTTKKWIQTKQWSLQEFKSIYRDLGIKFDAWFFESEEDEEGKRIANELLRKGIAEKNEGAIIVNLERYGLAVALVLKTDGTTLYLTKDLSLAQKKFEKYKIDKSIYVVDSRQSLHLKQAFKILELMGFHEEMIHVSYEFVSTKDGPISSRKGNVYLYEDLKERLVKKLIAETSKRHPEWPAKKVHGNSSVIANGALKFGMLKIDNTKEIIFDEDEWLDFEGETGPYIQYTYARIKSILRKAKHDGKKKQAVHLDRLSTSEDSELLRIIEHENDTINDASTNYRPSIIARYVLELCQKANEYYHKHPVISEDTETMKARLALFDRVQQSIKNNLRLLGIQVVEEM